MVRVVFALISCAAWTLWMTTAAGQTPANAIPFGEHASLALNKAAMRAQGAAPALLEKVGASAYRYFRLLAPQFAARTCYEFRDLRWRLPSVAVHGDAHIEQFVVTADTFGLADFDRAGFGPAVVDLVRYAAAIRLACRESAWPCDAARATDAYFDAYRTALDHPVTRAQPAVVNRLRAGVSQDRAAWLQWAESLMQPLDAAEEQALRKGWQRFIDLMLDISPQRPSAFYRIVRAGALHMGIGSALEHKVLIRIAGPSEAPEDDVILEARTTTTPNGHECVSRPVNGGSLHVVMLGIVLGQRMPDVFGFLPREGAREAPELWIHSWDGGYRELSLTDLQSQTDLNELARDAASQLAGHFWMAFPEPLRGHQRFAQLRAFEMTADRSRSLATKLADETVAAWERFRRQR